MRARRCLLAATLAVSSLSLRAADVGSVAGTGYLVDHRGVFARSGTGLCWRAGYWSPAMAAGTCDPDLVAKPTSPVSPSVAAAETTPSKQAAPVRPKSCNFTTTLENDETFAFDKFALTSAAKRRLDADVIAKLPACASVDLILVTGHADRLGSHSYNQQLSERRAKAVLIYLTEKGVRANETDIMGAGKTQPAKSCDSKLNHAQLIRCLAANRRVVVDVKGPAR